MKKILCTTVLTSSFLFGMGDVLATALHRSRSCQDFKMLNTSVFALPRDANTLEKQLINASKKGHLNIVKYLVEECHANVEAKTKEGATPLFFASRNGHFDIVKYLIEQCHCNVAARDNEGNTPLHWALLLDRLDIVKYFVEKCHCNVAARDNKGKTLLHLASSRGHLDIVQYLVEKRGCDVDAKGRIFDDYGRPYYNNGLTGLHLASQCGHLDIVKYLVEECHANVKAKDDWGNTPLHWASQCGHLDIVKYLVEECHCAVDAKDKLDRTPLHEASLYGHLNIVRYLVDERRCAVDAKDRLNETPLHEASLYGHLNIVKYLIEECHCDVETKGNDYNTPLHYAAQGSHFDVVKYLIEECHCNIAARTYHQKQIPFSMADVSIKAYMKPFLEEKLDSNVVEKNDLKDVECIIEDIKFDYLYKRRRNGSSKEVKITESLLLNMALAGGHLDVIKYLIENKHCDVNSKNEEGFIPLYTAFGTNRLDIVRYLVEKAHCDINVEDKWGHHLLNSPMVSPYASPDAYSYFQEAVFKNEVTSDTSYSSKCEPHNADCIHKVIETGRLDKVRELIEKDHCNVETKDNNGNTLLHLASQSGYFDIVKYLVEECYCYVKIKNDEGVTPLHLASQGGHVDIVKYLIEECHFNVDSKDNNGNTPLHLARQKGHLDIVKYLVEECHCDVGIKNDDKTDSVKSQQSNEIDEWISERMQTAVRNRNLSEIKRFILDGVVSKDTCDKYLYLAAELAYLDVVRCLIEECNTPITNEVIKKLHEIKGVSSQKELMEYLDLCNIVNEAMQNGEYEPIEKFVLTQVKKYLQDNHKGKNGTYFNLYDRTCELLVGTDQDEIEGYISSQIQKKTDVSEKVREILNEILNIALSCKVDKPTNEIEIDWSAKFTECLNKFKGIRISNKKSFIKLADQFTKSPELKSNSAVEYLLEHCVKDGGVLLSLIQKNKRLQDYFLSRDSFPDNLDKAISITINKSSDSNEFNKKFRKRLQLGFMQHIMEQGLKDLEDYVSNICCGEIPLELNEEPVTPLQWAAVVGNDDVLKYCIDKFKLDRNALEKFPFLPIMSARGSLDIMKQMLKDELNTLEKHKRTINLQKTQIEGQRDRIQSLIEEVKRRWQWDLSKYYGKYDCRLCEKNGGFSFKFGNNVPSSVEKQLNLELKEDQSSLDTEKYELEKAEESLRETIQNFIGTRLDQDGRTLLYYASTPDVAKFLIDELGCGIEDKDKNGITPLFLAAERGWLDMVKYFVDERHCNLRVKDEKGRTPLYYASTGNVAKYFVEECLYEATATDNSSQTPLHIAAQEGYLGVVKYLVGECNCDVEAKNKYGITPLRYAAQYGHLDIVKYLVGERRCKVSSDLINVVTNLKIKRYLEKVQTQASPSDKAQANKVETPVQTKVSQSDIERAIRSKNLDFVKSVVSRNQSNNLGLLHIAAEVDCLEIVQYLVEECYFDVNQRYLCGSGCNIETALDVATGESKDYLKKITGKDIWDAAKDKDLFVIKYLIGLGKFTCDSKRSEDGFTPLHCAVETRNYNIVMYLVNTCCCNIEIKNNKGLTPVDIAIEKVKTQADYDRERSLSDWRVFTRNSETTGSKDVDEEYEDKNTKCAKKIRDYLLNKKHKLLKLDDIWSRIDDGDLDAVKYILNQRPEKIRPGEDVIQKKDHSGKTLLHHAAQRGHLDIVKYLVRLYYTYDTTCDKDNKGNSPLDLAANEKIKLYLTYCNKFLHNEEAFAQCNNMDNSEIWEYVKNGKMGEVQYFCLALAKSLVATASNKYNLHETLLHIVSQGGCLEVVKYLVEECHCKVNAEDDEGKTPLHYAAQGGHLDIVQYLVEKCHCMVCPPRSLRTPLILAARAGHVDVVKYLDEKSWGGWKHGVWALVSTIDDTDAAENVKAYFRYKSACSTGSTKFKESTPQKISNGSCITSAYKNDLCIFSAIDEKDLEAVKRCIHKDSDIYTVNKRGETCFHYAAQWGGLDIVQYMVEEKHGDVTVKNKRRGDRTILHYATQGGHLDMVQYLVEICHCDVTVKDKYGVTPLHYAAQYGHIDIVKYLVEICHCDVEAKDNNGLTPINVAKTNEIEDYLQEAVESNDNDMSNSQENEAPAKTLDIKKTENPQNTEIFDAIEKDQLDQVKILIQRDHINVETKNWEGLTPLGWAAFNGYLDIVKYLVEECHADIEAKDKDGKTPLYWASRIKHLDIVKYLVEECHAQITEGIIKNAMKKEIRSYLQNAVKSNDNDISNSQENEALAKTLDIKKTENPQNTEIFDAIEKDQLGQVQILIQNDHINVETKNGKGLTPLSWAAFNGYLDIVKYLAEECHADIEAKDNNGLTPLYWASRRKHLEIVKYLVEECHAQITEKTIQNAMNKEIKAYLQSKM